MSEKVLIVLEARKFATEFPEDCVFETQYGDQYFAGDIVAEVVPGYTTDNIFYAAHLVDEKSPARHKRTADKYYGQLVLEEGKPDEGE